MAIDPDVLKDTVKKEFEGKHICFYPYVGAISQSDCTKKDTMITASYTDDSTDDHRTQLDGVGKIEKIAH